MNARTLQDGGLETVLANQELMVANSHAEQLKCCSISALMVAFRGPSFSGVLKRSQGQLCTAEPCDRHMAG